MPHATDDETMNGVGDDALVASGLGGDFDHGGAFDQTDKAADAVDYEDFDISDDDLPEEEAATNVDLEDEEEYTRMVKQFRGVDDSLPVQAPSGYHEAQPPSDHSFDDPDEANDLFGERLSSPEDGRRPQQHAWPQPRPGGLALPSKSSLALPGVYQQTHAPAPLHSSMASAMSPATESDDDDIEDDDPQVAMQKRLFRDAQRRQAGEEVEGGLVETDITLFNTLYPSYNDAEAPRFIDLFPPRNVEYKGKVPLKPPKAIHPSKLSLDLLQDQERSFKLPLVTNKSTHDSTFNNSFIRLNVWTAPDNESDEEVAGSALDEDQPIGGVSMQDLALICQDWDALSADMMPTLGDVPSEISSDDGDWDADEQLRPAKKRKTDIFRPNSASTLQDAQISFESPERAATRIAKAVTLDLNDSNLLVDEQAPGVKRKMKRVPGDKRDATISRDIAKRYNISNDQAYELLKENHQHKVRSTLGSMAIEHSYPAAKLQYPFYRVGLDNKAKRAFHRPHLELKLPPGREYRFQKPRHIKRKNVKGKEAKEVFAKAEDLSLGDNASVLLLEYSEEAPMMMSNFGMGNRLINYYRKRDAEDQERPKRDIGEAQVLLAQDKSPFANFGHVEHGETVPTIQNGLYRAPIFAHESKTTDFIVGVSSTYETGDRLFLRNAENLHVVGQQFPLSEVPGQHSRKVTDAAKKRLRALSYRIWTKSQTRRDKVLDNATLMPHLPGHDMPQTRSKMREFMKYERVPNRGDGSAGVWVPQPGQPVPDAETLRSWIRPEDVCLLDSMQVGVQHLADLGISETKDGDDDKDIDEGSNIEQQLAPWRATKNFLNACQGKAMLKLHGDGDPTNRGEGFSFVKTSMKGGFQAVGESVEDKLDAKRRKENGGHSYNVAKQQKSYEDSIRRIWNAQKSSLGNDQVYSDDELDEEAEDGESGRANTPRSSFGTPAAFASRRDDEYMSQFSGHSAGRGEKSLVIKRNGGIDSSGRPREDIYETITDPRVIRQYKKKQLEKQYSNKSIDAFVPTGDKDQDEFQKQRLQKELARVVRNAERREAREKLKSKKGDGESPSAAASPGPSDVDGPASNADGTPQKGKGRSKDGTARKCANCGQVGHIKTNRKSVPTFTCLCSTNKKTKQKTSGSNGSHGRRKDGGARGAGPGGANGGAATSFASDSFSEFVL